MPAFLRLRFALLLCLLFAGTAAANITYTYGTVDFEQGRLTGSFTATEAAIADGILTADELTANFVLSNTAAPFAPAEFTPPEFDDFLLTVEYGDLHVDRSSGEPYSDIFGWNAVDSSTGQRLFLSLIGVEIYPTSSFANGVQVRRRPTVSGGGPGAGGGPGGGPGNDITYTFRTTQPASLGGTLNGALVVPKAAIADGTIAFADLTSANFTLSDATAPFTSKTFTLADFRPRFITPGATDQIRVDPVSGAFLHDFQITAATPGTNLTTLELYPHRYAVWPDSGLRPTSRGLGSFTVSGGGAPVGGGTTPVELPALDPLALLALALLLVLFVVRARVPAQR